MTQIGYQIVLDFDGTVVKHRYPAVGEDIGAVPVLRRLVANGHRLLLNTMRSRDSEGEDTLEPAVEWFAANQIPLYGVNENPSQKEWTSSPKVYGHIYIDDAAIGAPLITYNSNFAPHRPYICWDNMYEYINEKKDNFKINLVKALLKTKIGERKWA